VAFWSKSGLSAGFELHFRRMANLRYLTGPLKSGKTAAAIQEIVSVLASGLKAAAILPSVHHIQYLTGEILRRQPSIQPGQLFMGTFFAWAERILDKNRQVFTTIPTAEEWLALRAITTGSNSPVSGHLPGYLQILQTIFGDLRESGLSAERLAGLFNGQENDEIKDWLGLFHALRKKYRSQSVGPKGESLVLALEILQNRPSDARGELLVVDGFYEFTPIQRQIVENLAESFTVTICTSVTDPTNPVYDYCRNRPGLLGKGDTVILPPPPNISDRISLLRNELFKNNPSPDARLSFPQSAWQNEWSGSVVKIVQCPNRHAEVETAARTIKRWIADGMKIERVGLTYRGSYDYAGLTALIFPDFGLPVVPPAKSLAVSEPAQILSRIIQVNTENFSRPLLMDLLRLSSIQRYYDPDWLQEFEIQSAEWGLPTSKAEWLIRCRERVEYLQFLQQNETLENGPASDRIQYQINQMRRIQPRLSQLLNDLTLPPDGSYAEYRLALNQILERFLTDISDSTTQQREKIQTILKRLERIGAAHGKITLNELGDILTRFFAAETIPPEIAQPGIYCGDLMDARGLQFDGLILLGLVDGEFPASRVENALFRNKQKRALNQKAGAQLFAESGADLAEEKFLLYLLTSRVSQRLLITYPEANHRGRALPVSSFIDELLSIGQKTGAVAWEIIPTSQIIPESEAIASTGDLLQVILSGKAENQSAAILAKLADQTQLTDALDRRNTEQSRLLGAGIYNGVCPADRSYPDFLKTPVTATKLQRYIDCPFAYLCDQIWRINVPDEPQIGLDPLATGILIHKTLEAFVKKFQETAARPWPDFLAAVDDVFLDNLIAGIAAYFRPQMNFVPGMLWEQIFSDLRNGLKKFIETERQFGATGFAPVKTEQQFTLQDEELIIGENPAIQVVLKGKVDRIDQDANGGRFLVIDYKRSGGTIMDIVKGVQNGRQFQIPLYLLMVAADSPSVKIGGAFYYSFNDGKRTRGFLVESEFGRTPSLSHAELDNLLAEARQRVAATLEQIYHGNFSLALRNDNHCRVGRCEFSDICRV
jgi:ATP-dependent helicase/nuclease subunit B